MRIDKYLGITGCATRAEAKKLIRSGAVTVNGAVVKSSDAKIDPERDKVIFCGNEVIYRRYTYILMNKPEGVVSATEDGRDRTVIDLLPNDIRKTDLFPCGRLDKNTLGLILITDNGELAHKLLAPKSHVEKKYFFKSKFPLTAEAARQFENGLTLEDGYETKPAKIELSGSGDEGVITLVEGKYHQIKRMLDALGNKITYLERISFGPLTLDESLGRGEWRYLTEEEAAALEAHGIKNENK
ncbi:MAG: rRNA pseudouridine synthase [Clostridia bacterium]|nr:rRNA pseudouridine synthase [Clostridia bacterium]